MTPRLTDRTALELHRARARQSGESALFLHETVRAEIDERLEEVNRTFKDPVIVTGFPEIWHDFPHATVIPDTETLALEPDAHDLVIHAMALHWSDDPVGQLVQCRHSLRPDGLLIAAALGGQTLQELRRALAEAETRVLGGLSPRVAPMAEIRDLGGLLQRAGLALPVADSRKLTTTYASQKHLLHDLRAMGETNALASRDRRIPPRRLFDLSSEIYAISFPAPPDRITATFEIIFLSGWSPSESQQRPLRPGSASQRLADALGTIETPAGDTTVPRQD